MGQTTAISGTDADRSWLSWYEFAGLTQTMPVVSPISVDAGMAKARSRAWPRSAVVAGLLTLVCPWAVPSARPQDLGEIARQERAHRQQQPSHTAHTYTEDDLARPQILTPEDRTRFHSARTTTEPPPAEAGAAAAENARPTVDPTQPNATGSSRGEVQQVGTPDQVSVSNEVTGQETVIPPSNLAVGSVSLEEMPLGDVARYYRALRAAADLRAAEKQSEGEARPAPSSRPALGTFPMFSIGSPALATMADHPAPLRPPMVKPSAPAPPAVANNRLEHRIAKLPQPTARLAEPIRSSQAGAAPASTGLGVGSRIRVRSGDTLWGLARRYLRSGTRWRELLAANGLSDPRRLAAGSLLILPN